MRFLAILFVLTGSTVWAQQDTEISAAPQSSGDSLRSIYIESFPDHFFLWPVLKQRKLDFELTNLTGKEHTLSYNTNKPYSFGIGMYLFELGFELTFAVPLDEQSKRIYGESDSRDLQLNVLGKKWGIDAYIQRYDGFYINDPLENIPVNSPYRQRPDIETRNIGITGNYTFNYNKFSFRSAYNFAERQVRSAGSFVIFGSLNSFRVEADSALLGSQYTNAYGELSDLYSVKTTALSIAPGYAYNLIYKGFFLNGTLAVGPSHNWLSYEVIDKPSVNDFKFSAFVTVRISLGYNGERFFGGLSFTNQGRAARFENIEMTNINSSFKILLGYRFKEFGILKKRVLDLPAALIK